MKVVFINNGLGHYLVSRRVSYSSKFTKPCVNTSLENCGGIWRFNFVVKVPAKDVSVMSQDVNTVEHVKHSVPPFQPAKLWLHPRSSS